MRLNRISVTAPVPALVLALVLAAPLAARAGDAVTVENAWARASAGGAGNGAAYLTVVNAAADDALISASADVSKIVELHEHTHENGIMRMRKIDSVAIPAHGSAVLKPSGEHVMLIGLNAPLKEGESFPMALTFKNAGTVRTTVKILGVGSMGPSGPGMNHEGMKH